MANCHSTKKAQFMVHPSHELRICLEKKAAEIGVTVSEAAIIAFENYTRGVQLTSDDYLEVARRVKKEEARRERKSVRK